MSKVVPTTTPAGGTMRPIPSMVADLRGLAKHIHAMDSGSGDAALLRDAANYIEGATSSLREHMDMVRRLRASTVGVTETHDEW